MSRKLTNITSNHVNLTIQRDERFSETITVRPNRSITITDQQYRNIIGRSSNKTLSPFSIEFIPDEVIDTEQEVSSIGGGDIATHDADSGAHSTLFGAKADKESAVAAADATVTAVGSAGAISGAFSQVEVQAVADLANDLKAKYDDAVTLINELKTKLDSMNS